MTLRYDIMLHNGRLGIGRIRLLLFAPPIMIRDIPFLSDFCQLSFDGNHPFSLDNSAGHAPFFFSLLQAQNVIHVSFFLVMVGLSACVGVGVGVQLVQSFGICHFLLEGARGR